MAVLATSGITLPLNIADGMFKKAATGSAVAVLSQAEPQKFGSVTKMTLNSRPRAEYVGEGGQKSSTNATFGSKTVTPHKVQVTMRFNEEVKWADEDYQLGILDTLSQEGALALARALDLGVFHGINPLAGTVVSSIAAGDRIATTTNSVEITTQTSTTPDLVLEQAAGLVISDGYVPNGIAFDPTSTVSGLPEAAANTNVKAIVGQWDLLAWGVQRNIPVSMIEFGDPDGQGDLKRNNQLALRMEVVYGWGIMDLDGFSTVKDAVANV